MELSHPYITTQKIVISINKKKYINEIAPARTFVFTNEDDSRLQNLPSYGIGVTKNRFYCATPLRFTNELVRHKILDLLGDLYVLQKKIEGKIIARNTSHCLNFAFVKKLMNLA
jgi:UDP-3-O-[3-hydroxymyristoyl] N-acetylglucosamine deacetylase